MANLLNYKYEIFPTSPQRKQLNRVLRESKYQWNKAVTIRKKLKKALEAGQFEYVIRKCLTGEEGKRETNHKRKGAILKILEEHPSLNINSATKLYNLRNIIGKDYELDKKTIQKRQIKHITFTLKYQLKLFFQCSKFQNLFSDLVCPLPLCGLKTAKNGLKTLKT